MSAKGHRKVKVPPLLQAIVGSGGVISSIAAELGVNWHTAMRSIEENEEAKALLEDELEKRLDMSESVVLTNIEMAVKQQKKGFFADTSDAKWYLSKKGKKRDYGEKLNIEHSGEISWKEFISGGSNSDAGTDSE